MSDKILKLSQAQTLYQDLRERINALPTDSDIPEVPVQDVQVNGVSVLDAQGVANVPLATNDTPGVAKVYSSYGISMNNNGFMTITPATEAIIKAGTDWYKPLGVRDLKASTFYGLAKAAGADMKDIANTTVGIYPDAQKAAIQNMLGISNFLAPVETTVASKAYSVGESFTSNGKLYKVTTAITQGGTIITQDVGATVSEHNAEETKISEYAVRDVQINGTSIMQNGVANVPIANVNIPGLIYGGVNGYGICTIQGVVCINPAVDADVKAATESYKPIVPARQDKATFYGLAKAAGVDLASETVTLGTYPNNAKTAIQTMLGVPSIDDILFEKGSGQDSVCQKISYVSFQNLADGMFSFASGVGTISGNVGSHSEGQCTAALAPSSHAEGQMTLALGQYSHAEGIGFGSNAFNLTGAANTTTYTSSNTTVKEKDIGSFIVYKNKYAQIVSVDTINNTITLSSTLKDALENETCYLYTGFALGIGSHVEGFGTIANCLGMHAQGAFNKLAILYPTWTANTEYTIGDRVIKSDYGYECIEANSDSSWTSSKWKLVYSTGSSLFTIGNGTDSTHRSNAASIDIDGNGHYAGNIYVGCNADSTGGTRLPHDIQINGTSIVSNGVANVPVASGSNLGLVKTAGTGIFVNSSGEMSTVKATSAQIKAAAANFAPIVPSSQHESTFFGLAKAAGDSTQSASSNAVGTYTDNAKASIKSMLGIVDGSTGTVTVSGTTPTITAVENTRYVCGEVATLSFTPPASGISIVRFTSGTTATVLTLPNTVIFPEWFDATALEANTIYEMCITDGIYGAVMSWAQ